MGSAETARHCAAKLRRLDPGNRALDECPELLALFIADGSCQVLNFDQALAYEYDLNNFRDAGDPGIANQLGIERQQPFGLIRITGSRSLPFKQALLCVKGAKRVDVGDEVVLARQAPCELDLLVLPRLWHSD